MSPMMAGGFFTTGTTWEAHLGNANECKDFCNISK